jgi:predicted dehydrogenase
MTGPGPLRVGLVGCGWYGQNHLHAWRALGAEGAALVGVADIDADKAAAAAQRFGVPAFPGLEALIEGVRPDLVDIVTTVGSHRTLVEAAAVRRVAAIVQKPMARDWSECLAMAKAVRAGGIFFGIHENFRFQAPIRRVQQLIGNGVIGSPGFARIAFRTAFDTTAAQPHLLAEKRFILMDIGVHVLDLARHLVGEALRVSCETQQHRPGLAGEDAATMLLRHESGAVSVVDCSFAAQRIVDAFPETMVEVEGDIGCIRLREGGWVDVKSRGVSWNENASAPLLEWSERPLHVTQESVLAFNRHVLEAWRAGIQPATDLEDGLRNFALVEAAYRAAETGQSVAPASPP